MSLFNWLPGRSSALARKRVKPRLRPAGGQTTLPLMSPRRGRRILRREQLFSVVRESLIRGGVLSTSYEFKVLTLDSNGDSFLVLIDLALPAGLMPDEYLLEIEQWIQHSAQARHSMAVPSVYWRRKPVHDQRGMALRAAVTAQTRKPPVRELSETAIAAPPRGEPGALVQAVAEDEVAAFRRALQTASPLPGTHLTEQGEPLPEPESHSDFAALSATQYGKL